MSILQFRILSILKALTMHTASGASLKGRIVEAVQCLAVSAALLASSALPAFAGPADPPVAVLVTRTAPGETTNLICGANGFVIVQFILLGAIVSAIESSDPCDTGAGGDDDTGGNNDDTGNVDNVVDEEPVFAGVAAQDAANDIDGSASAFLPQTVNGGDVSSVFRLPSPPLNVPGNRPENRENRQAPQQNPAAPQNQITRVAQDDGDQEASQSDDEEQSGKACDKCREELLALFETLGPLSSEIAKLERFINRESDRIRELNVPQGLVRILSGDKAITDPVTDQSDLGRTFERDQLARESISPDTIQEAERLLENSNVDELIAKHEQELSERMERLKESRDKNTKRIELLKKRIEDNDFSADTTPHVKETFGERIERLQANVQNNEKILNDSENNLSAESIAELESSIETDKNEAQHSIDVLLEQYDEEIKERGSEIEEESGRISDLGNRLDILSVGGVLARNEVAAIIVVEAEIRKRNQQTEATIRKFLKPDVDKLAALKKDRDELLNALNRKEKQCDALCNRATGSQANLTPRPGTIAQTRQSPIKAYASFGTRGKPAQRAIDQTVGTNRRQGLSVSGRDRRVNARFDLRQWRQAHGDSKHGITARIDAAHTTNGLSALFADPKFNLFASFGGAFGENKAAGLGQDSTSYGMSGGVSYLVIPNLNLGVAGRFGKADIDSARSEIDASTWGIAGFAQTQIVGINLQATAAWSRTDIGSLFNNAGVVTDADTVTTAFSGQVSASTSFAIASLSVSPSASISYIGTERDAFALSDGQVAPGQGSDVVVFGLGTSFGTTFDLFDGSLRFSPSVGFGVSDTARDLGNPSLTTSAGLGIAGTNGISGNFGLGFSGVTGDTRNVSFSGGLTIPLN